MGISTLTSTTSTFNLRYSAFLGILYVSNTETEAAIKAAKANAGGDEVVKKGFQGSTGNTPSANALKELRDHGVTSVKVSGILTSARVVERDIAGHPTPYLSVGVRDDDGRYYISVELGQPAAQMLVRKLACCKPGIQTEISMFATYAAKPGATRTYADHGASLKQNGQEIAGIKPATDLIPQINAALSALEDAGVNKVTDKETFNRRRSKIETDFHVSLLNNVNSMFTEHYEAIEQSETSHVAY